jgi:hypothetical protein
MRYTIASTSVTTTPRRALGGGVYGKVDRHPAGVLHAVAEDSRWTACPAHLPIEGLRHFDRDFLPGGFQSCRECSAVVEADE